MQFLPSSRMFITSSYEERCEPGKLSERNDLMQREVSNDHYFLFPSNRLKFNHQMELVTCNPQIREWLLVNCMSGDLLLGLDKRRSGNYGYWKKDLLHFSDIISLLGVPHKYASFFSKTIKQMRRFSHAIGSRMNSWTASRMYNVL